MLPLQTTCWINYLKVQLPNWQAQVSISRGGSNQDEPKILQLLISTNNNLLPS
jgi:hypothetical protein